MIVLIDNYDSFSYNLYQLIGELGEQLCVVRNDELTLQEIEALHPSHIILSPGPGYPKEAGICMALVKALGHKIPILGVCLGHQAICQSFGAVITHAPCLMHGKQSDVEIDQSDPLFETLPATIQVARYHSLVAQQESIPACLATIATTKSGDIMAVKHKTFPIYGVQFHPESILTPEGKTILSNFIKIGRAA